MSEVQNQPAQAQASQYVSPINTVRVPVWVVRVAGGLLLILGAGAAATVFVCIVWVALLTTAVSTQGQRAKGLQQQAAANQKKLDKALKDLNVIQNSLEEIKKKGTSNGNP